MKIDYLLNAVINILGHLSILDSTKDAFK